MERIAPAGDVYQAGTLSGQPARRRRRARDAARARRRRLRAARRAHRAARRRPRATLAGDRAAAGRRRSRASLTLFFSAEPVRRLRRRPGLRPRGLRPLLPRPARARRLPARLAVRGLVRLARPRRRGDRRDDRRRGRGLRAGPRLNGALISHFAMTSTAISLTALAALLRDGETRDLAVRARLRRGAGARCSGGLRAARRRRAGGVHPPGRGDPRGLPAPLRDPAADRRRRRRPAAARGRLPLRAGLGASRRRGATSTRCASSPT